MMKYLKTYKIFENSDSDLELKLVLKKYGIWNYTIDSDGFIDVNDHVDLAVFRLHEIPYNFGRISKNFNCSTNKLTSLKGCPLEVGGHFFCTNNQLTSLEGSPSEIGGNFYCTNNQLTSLEGCPSEVGGSFICSSNQLTSLEYCPSEINGYFDCSHNKLTMLDCSSYIKGHIYCYGMFNEEPEFFGDCEGKIIW